ncbi:uroporphyrinogen-III C-methyltransferase [Ramlibacter sp. PS4R-6]|uniref:uroporphyrinogen-III C-methyltransferase n=1 Tax=Ramlibacter sp. PS4R-6 TaxID=3133438 RepID=UPI0030A9DBBA
MSSEPNDPSLASSQVPALEPAPPPASDPASAPGAVVVTRGLLYALIIVAGLALLASGLLWQRLSNIQEQLARQSQESGNTSVEARTLAKQAQELARETAARQAVLDTRLAEVALQRSQVEELVQSLSRSRDENMLVDIESGLRLAQQQAQLTGSVEPLLAAMRGADQRLERSGQPRLARVRSAVLRDIDRIKGATVADVPSLLARLDEITRQVDELPLANATAAAPAASARRKEAPTKLPWWEQALADIREEARGLVRVSRIDEPEAVLLSPDQGFFVRENVKLKLLNARLEVLSRQMEAARADVTSAGAALRKYFDANSRKTQGTVQQLQQVQSQLRAVEVPRIDETLAVLATAAAGR